MHQHVIESPPRTLIRCPLCSSDRLEYEFNLATVPVSRCADCTLLFLNPHPADDGDDRPSSRVDVAVLVRREVERLRQVAHLGKSGADILAVVPWLPANAANVAARVVTEQQMLDGAVAHETFDACAFVHVLERSRDPQSALAVGLERLRPGGSVSVTCSSIDSPAARYFGARWWGFEPSTRLYFGVNTLQNCMARAGLGEFIVFHENEPERLHPNAPIIVRALKILGLRRAAAHERYGKRLLASELTIVGRCVERGERPKLSVIVPVYNERRTFNELIERVLDKTIDGIDIEIIIVESNSTDGTRADVIALSDHPRVTVILQDRAQGKGNAVRAGLAHATGDIVLFQDADLEYDVGDYDQLVRPIAEFRQNFVIGSRHNTGSSWKIRDFNKAPILSQVFNLGHLIFLGLLNSMYGQKMADPFSMFKVFRRDCLAGLSFECNRFDFDFEIVIKLLRKGYRPIEIPVNYHSRSIEEGKKVTMIRDPLTWIRALVKYRRSELYSAAHTPHR
jgi:hypothetical protein